MPLIQLLSNAQLVKQDTFFQLINLHALKFPSLKTVLLKMQMVLVIYAMPDIIWFKLVELLLRVVSPSLPMLLLIVLLMVNNSLLVQCGIIVLKVVMFVKVDTLELVLAIVLPKPVLNTSLPLLFLLTVFKLVHLVFVRNVLLLFTLMEQLVLPLVLSPFSGYSENPLIIVPL